MKPGNGGFLPDEETVATSAAGGSVLGIMQTPVSTLQSTDSLRKAIHLLGSARGKQSPVLKGDQLVGLVCNCDLSQLVSSALRELSGGEEAGVLERIRIHEMLVGKPVSIGPYHSVVAAAQVLLDRGVCALPVVDERRVVGMVSQTELLRALVILIKELQGIIGVR